MLGKYEVVSSILMTGSILQEKVPHIPKSVV